MPFIAKIIISIFLAGAVGTGVYVSQNTDVAVEEKEVVAESNTTASSTTGVVSSSTSMVTVGINVGVYKIIASESLINWESQKPLIPGYVHKGTIGLSSGSIDMKSENSASGSVIIDMNSIKVTSLGGGKEGRESALETHLKNKDFFDVGTYSTGTFTIDSITPVTGTSYNVTGKLTLKGITKPISFPITFVEKDGKITADGSVSIDRTQWGINFASKSLLGIAANSAISRRRAASSCCGRSRWRDGPRRSAGIPSCATSRRA